MRVVPSDVLHHPLADDDRGVGDDVALPQPFVRVEVPSAAAQPVEAGAKLNARITMHDVCVLRGRGLDKRLERGSTENKVVECEREMRRTRPQVGLVDGDGWQSD